MSTARSPTGRKGSSAPVRRRRPPPGYLTAKDDPWRVIAIFGPNFTHIETVEAIVDEVKKGAQLKGLICEKPLGRNLAEARKLVELVKPLGIPTSYFENQIHMKSIQAALTQLTPVIRSHPFLINQL